MKTIQELLCNESVMMTAIVANTVIMFVGGFWPDNKLFVQSDALFTILFLFEAAAKISKGWKNYWKDGWNRFDLIVLIIALPSLATLFVEQSMTTNAILALRSLRLFKSLKMLKFIPNIQKLLKGLKLACKASFLVFISFVLFLVIFSILSSTIFEKIDPEHFGNPAISLYNIFRLFSVEGWYELPETIAANGNPHWGFFARCYFTILVFLGGIIGLSLVNSIFVDAMANDNNDKVIEKLNKIEEQIQKMSISNANNDS